MVFRARAHRDASDRDAHQVGVAQAGLALRPGYVLELLSPPRRVGICYLPLADELIEHQVKQTVIAPYGRQRPAVPPDGDAAGRCRARYLPEAAHYCGLLTGHPSEPQVRTPRPITEPPVVG
jgi:hypothetical protein